MTGPVKPAAGTRLIEILDCYDGRKTILTLERHTSEYPPYLVKAIRIDRFRTEAAAQKAFMAALPERAKSYRQKNHLD